MRAMRLHQASPHILCLQDTRLLILEALDTIQREQLKGLSDLALLLIRDVVLLRQARQFGLWRGLCSRCRFPLRSL